MRALVLLAVLSGCPDQEPIGRTEWITTTPPGSVRVSSGGRIVESGTEFVRARDRDGTQLWEQSMTYNEAVDVDSAGNVYVGRAEGMAGRRLYALAAADGAPQWSVSFGVSNITLVVVAADDVVWCFRAEAGVTRWTQYRPSGEEIASGTLSFLVQSAVALPGGGLLVHAASLSTLDKAGATTWEGTERVSMFALHEDGEISAFTGSELIRFTTDHQVRWRRRVSDASTLRAVGDRLLVGSYTQVGSELELFDRDGGSAALERFSVHVVLDPAGRGDVYFLTYFGTRSVDLHDRVVPFEDIPVGQFLAGLVARRL